MKLRIMSVCAAMTTLAGAASADPVTYTFTGHVTWNAFASGALADVSVDDGATWQYTFENSASGSFAANGERERYAFENTISSGSVLIGNVSASSDGGPIVKTNSLSGAADTYSVFLFGTGLVPANNALYIQLTDTSGTVFNSSSIASLSPDLNFDAFSQKSGSLIEGGTSNRLNIVWTSLVIDNPVIPLPTTAAMAFVGLGMIGVRRRRSASPNEV